MNINRGHLGALYLNIKKNVEKVFGFNFNAHLKCPALERRNPTFSSLILEDGPGGEKERQVADPAVIIRRPRLSKK
jgi:hypothetical protein